MRVAAQVMGHRAWNAQLGQRLMDFGVLVVAVDFYYYCYYYYYYCYYYYYY